MSNVTSTLDIVLKDDVSSAAQRIAASLHKMEAEARAVDGALSKTGTSNKLQASLKRIGAELPHIEAVARAWRDYAKAEGLAADRSQWTKSQIAGVKSWESINLASVRSVMAMERALEEQRARQSAQHRQQMEAEVRAAHRAAEQQQHLQARMGVGHAVLTSAALAVSGHSILHGISEAIQKGGELEHERIGLRNAGRTPEEMAEIEAASRATVRDLPTAGYTESMKVIAETTSAFGSLHHAIENLPFMMQTMASLKAAAGDKIEGDAGTVGRYFAKFFEERMTKPEDFQKEAKQMIPAMVASGGVFNPQEMFAFAQQAKSSLPNYDMQFLSRVIPSLVTTMGGNRAGTAANAFTSVITGKVNDKKQAEAFQKLGLLDMSKVIMKSGHAVGWSAGAVKDTMLALTNPLKWAETYLIPALQKAGVDTGDRLAVTTALATMFRNQNANMFANEITQEASRNRLHKDENLYNQVGSADEIYQRNLGDLKVASGAFMDALGDLAAAVTGPLIGPTARGLSALASAIHQISDAAMAHPNIAAGAGIAGAGVALGGAGYLGYQLMNGFGLGTAATALEGSAAAIDAAAGRLGVGGLVGPGGMAASEAVAAEVSLAAALTGFASAAAPLTAALGLVMYAAQKQKEANEAEIRNRNAPNRSDLPNLDDQTSKEFWTSIPWLRPNLPKTPNQLALGFHPDDDDRLSRARKSEMDGVPLPPSRPAWLPRPEEFGPPKPPTPLLPPVGWFSDQHPQPAFPHTRTNEAPIGDGLRDPHGPVLGGSPDPWLDPAQQPLIDARALIGASHFTRDPEAARGQRMMDNFGPAAGGSASAAPTVDTSGIKAAAAEAQQAGAQIQAALDISASPRVDTAPIDTAIAKARQFLALMQQAASVSAGAAGGAAGGGGVSAGRGFQPAYAGRMTT